MNISSFLIGYQTGKNSGGGSAADVRYVTFMSYDGSIEYGKKAVAVGDDCADPIARGVFDTPTRESTAQYHYTFYGWSNAANGGADDNWNKAITEDKTVYANFSAAVRYYTITYLDSDGSTLKTETLQYGATPNYKPEKEGFGFGGWSPALATVTGNATYTAVWTEKITFANGSWADIARISEAGEAAEYFKVGDSKTFEYKGDLLKVAIAGFNHDEKADGTGKAGMSIICMNLANEKEKFLNSYSSTNNNTYLFSNSKLRSELNGDWFNSLPTELRSVIKPVLKEVDAFNTMPGTGEDVGITTTTDKLWALSLTELGWVNNYPRQYVPLGSKYDIFPNTFTSFGGVENAGFDGDAHLIGTTGNYETSGYWTRSLCRGTSLKVCYIARTEGTTPPTGKMSTAQSNNTTGAKYVRFGFCI